MQHFELCEFTQAKSDRACQSSFLAQSTYHRKVKVIFRSDLISSYQPLGCAGLIFVEKAKKNHHVFVVLIDCGLASLIIHIAE